MTVKIVTDSISDLPPDVVSHLGITVIPMVIKFGEASYLEGINITSDEFYQRLVTSPVFPVTSVPPPEVFISTYEKLAVETDEILVITVSSKLAAIYTVAQQARHQVKKQCHIEVMDSNWAAMAEGFVVIAAAEAARAGASYEEIKDIAQHTIKHVDLHATFDTLEYLRRGGRIGHARLFLGTVLRTNPIITLKNGVVEPVTQTRTRARAIEQLIEFVRSFSEIEKMAVENAACDDEAEKLIDRLAGLFPRERILRSRITPAMGAHTGPGSLLVAVQGTGHHRV